MNVAMRTMVCGIDLQAPAQSIRSFNEVVACPLLLESRGGQILPHDGGWMGRLPFERKPGFFRGDDEAVLVLLVLPDSAQVKHLHSHFPQMSVDFGMRDER